MQDTAAVWAIRFVANKKQTGIIIATRGAQMLLSMLKFNT
jgi:hypothetical protein